MTTPDGPSELESLLLKRLGINRDCVPDDFSWWENRGMWIKTITVDPAGEYGYTEQETHKLYRLVEQMNEAMPIDRDVFGIKKIEHYRPTEAFGACRN
jgi:hypothetical protein